MSATFLIEVLGFVAAILTTLSFLPQALRIRRQRSAADVSLVMYLMMLTGQALWLIYGVLFDSPSLIAANVVGISLVGWVLVMKLAHLRQQRRMMAAAPVGLQRPVAAE
jgi:MtN3 and saliva related transmembrane protein